jgi:hypothetical protein
MASFEGRKVKARTQVAWAGNLHSRFLWKKGIIGEV